MKKSLAFLLAACLLAALCACAGSGQDGETLEVYRVLKTPWQTNGELLRPETVRFDHPPQVEDALDAVFSEPEDPQLSNGMGTAAVVDWSLSGGEISLELSEAYGNLTNMRRTIAEYCLTLTLVQLEGVEAVSIYCDGVPTALGLTAGDALLYDIQSNPYEKQVRLYFSDGADLLIEETRGLSVDEDMPTERYVLEELLRGPVGKSLSTLLPEGTRLLSVSTRDGVCTVDLSGEFLAGDYRDDTHRRLAVYSLVNTLTALPDVDAVELYAGGAPVERFGLLTIEQPLERCDALVGPVNSARGEVALTLYFLGADGRTSVAAPRIIETLDYASAAEAVLAVLTDPESEPTLQSPFAGVEILNVQESGGVCTVDLPGSFFQGLGREAMETAVSLLVRSLTGLPEVGGVRLFRDGESFTLYGRDYSQIITG